MGLKVNIFGSRGSIATPQSAYTIEEKVLCALHGFFQAGYSEEKDIAKYFESLTRSQKSSFGGNTACYKVDSDKQMIIIDGGSGLRSIGAQLMKEECGQGNGEVHIFLTHFHWDHLVGFNFFIPLFIPGNKIHLYGVQDEIHEFLKVLFKKPYFPIEYKALGAEIHYHQLEPRVPFQLNDMTITPYQLDHPDPCWGYRIESDGKSYAHCVDTECIRVSRKDLGEDLPLYQNADLMIFDAQYSLNEAIQKTNWGHSAAVIGLDIAKREHIKQAVFVHHDPYASDKQIEEIVTECIKTDELQKKRAKQKGEDVFDTSWCFGYDGLEIIL